jgi:DNA ligase 1
MAERVVKPMLAKDGDLSKITYPVVVQPKLDGIRCLVVDGVARSRTFKSIPNAEIQAVLGRPEFNGLDGEIVVGSATAEGCMQTTSSFVMSEDKTGEDWTYFVFDRWDSDKSYADRRKSLIHDVKLWRASASWPNRILFVEEDIAHDYEELMHLESGWVAGGHEGIIVRDPNAPYKHGRSGIKGPLLKVKRFIDFEAEIIGVYEEQHNANEAKRDAFGRTERSTAKAGKVGKGRLGGFYLRALNGPCEGVEFKCGTGFSAAQREAWWESKSASYARTAARWKGQVAKIKSFPIGVKEAPRFPVFLGFRDMAVDG